MINPKKFQQTRQFNQRIVNINPFALKRYGCTASGATANETEAEFCDTISTSVSNMYPTITPLTVYATNDLSKVLITVDTPQLNITSV